MSEGTARVYINELRAEIERLRAALKKIVDTFESKLEDADAAQIMGETAREALTAATGETLEEYEESMNRFRPGHR